MTLHSVHFPIDRLARFCQAHGVARLSLFGSILTEHFGPESDVDVLVEFRSEATPTLFSMASMEFELTDLLGRKVDLRTAEDLSTYFRSAVVGKARLLHAA